jgi:hypothetical protein
LAGLTDLRVEPQVEFVLNRGPSDPPGFVHGVRTQIWGGMVWNASPVQRFAATEGVYTEQLRAELQAQGLADVRLLSLPPRSPRLDRSPRRWPRSMPRCAPDGT